MNACLLAWGENTNINYFNSNGFCKALGSKTPVVIYYL